jgi:hypothetical protein
MASAAAWKIATTANAAAARREGRSGGIGLV